MADGAERVRAYLEERGRAWQVVRYESGTGTAAEAAAAVGCSTGEIVKTLCLVADGLPTLALVAGDRQVDVPRLATMLGVRRKRLRMARAEEVRTLTGFPVGGVTPFALARECDVVVDESILRFQQVWLAAGTANAVVEVPVAGLLEVTGGKLGAFTKEPAGG